MTAGGCAPFIEATETGPFATGSSHQFMVSCKNSLLITLYIQVLQPFQFLGRKLISFLLNPDQDISFRHVAFLVLMAFSAR